MEKELFRYIFKKYILPTKRPAAGFVGIEIEMPIVNIDGCAVDFETVHKMAEKFVEYFKYNSIKRDDDGEIYQAMSEESGDGISFDCSYNTLEISFGIEEDIKIIDKRFKDYVSFIQNELKRNNHMITGMGINPNYKVNNNIPIPNERYRMLFHHLASYKKYEGEKLFHDYPNFGFFSCASQVQLDVEEKNIVKTINTFSKLEPLKAVLFSNSLWQQDEQLICSRDKFWRESLHGLNLHNVDMYELNLSDEEEIIEYIKSMSIYCVIRNNRYINFEPLSLREYFKKAIIEGEYYDGQQYQKIKFKPEYDDISYLRSFKFQDLTYRGTIEFRSVCTQPLYESMTVVAFHAGLINKIDDLEILLNNDRVIYGHGYSATELRKMFCKSCLPDFVCENKLKKLLIEVLNLAKDGLIQRGHGEEKYLQPLFARAEKLTNPALTILEGIQNDIKMDYFVREYSKI